MWQLSFCIEFLIERAYGRVLKEELGDCMSSVWSGREVCKSRAGKSREVEICPGKENNEGWLQQDRIHVCEGERSK